MIALSWQLALSSLVILPLMAVITGAIASRSCGLPRRAAHARHDERQRRRTSRVCVQLSPAKETIDEFRAINRENRDAGVRAQQIVALLMLLIDVMKDDRAIIAGLGGWLTRNAPQHRRWWRSSRTQQFFHRCGSFRSLPTSSSRRWRCGACL